MPAVTRAKSPGSTPCAVNRGPQLAMAEETCASAMGAGSRGGDPGAGHDLGRVVAEVGEQHGGRVAPGGAGDGSARVRAAAGLVETGNGHPVAGPAGHRAQRTAERGTPVAAV